MVLQTTTRGVASSNQNDTIMEKIGKRILAGKTSQNIQKLGQNFQEFWHSLAAAWWKKGDVMSNQKTETASQYE